MQVKVSDYPQLAIIAWNRRKDYYLDGADAFGIYERNWGFVDEDSLTQKERDPVDLLAKKFGNGIFDPM